MPVSGVWKLTLISEGRDPRIGVGWTDEGKWWSPIVFTKGGDGTPGTCDPDPGEVPTLWRCLQVGVTTKGTVTGCPPWGTAYADTPSIALVQGVFRGTFAVKLMVSLTGPRETGRRIAGVGNEVWLAPSL